MLLECLTDLVVLLFVDLFCFEEFLCHFSEGLFGGFRHSGGILSVLVEHKLPKLCCSFFTGFFSGVDCGTELGFFVLFHVSYI